MQRDDLVRSLGVYLDELAALLDLPRKQFSSLAERDVPESGGLYVIYREEPRETFYVGKASRRKKPSALGQPDGLRFRNLAAPHRGRGGNDQFGGVVRDRQGPMRAIGPRIFRVSENGGVPYLMSCSL
jgi:hypothetical protein